MQPTAVTIVGFISVAGSPNVPAVFTGLATQNVVGGGPIVPPPAGSPPGIWGGNDPYPTPPIAFPPGWVGGVPPKPPGGSPPSVWPNPPEGTAPIPGHPIALPGDPWWPSDPAPVIPPPGSPPTVLPGTTPVHPITPPPAIVVDYPGVGKVLVPLPASPPAAPPAKK